MDTALQAVLALTDIRTDGGTQAGADIDQATVEEYADTLQAGAIFAPIVIFADSTGFSGLQMAFTASPHIVLLASGPSPPLSTPVAVVRPLTRLWANAHPPTNGVRSSGCWTTTNGADAVTTGLRSSASVMM